MHPMVPNMHHPKNVVGHEMSTTNRGVVSPLERDGKGAPTGRAGRIGRNAFIEPEDFQTGPQGRVGGGDPWNTNDADGDFDGTMYEGL